MKNNNIQKGFTMIELIVYLAIAILVLMAVVGIGLNLRTANERSQAKREVYMNARFIENQLAQKIHGADDVLVTGSTFGSNPGKLALAYPSGNNVIFETFPKNVTVNGRTVAIKKLSMKVGSASYIDLTTDKVDVTNFTLTNLTRGSSRDNINIQLILTKVNPDNDPNYAATIELSTALSIRK